MVPLQRNFYVAAKFFHSRVAERNPEITAGHVFQFMSLIEDHCAYIGQNACIGRILRLLLDLPPDTAQFLRKVRPVARDVFEHHLEDQAGDGV